MRSPLRLLVCGPSPGGVTVFPRGGVTVMFNSFGVYGVWLIGGIAGLVAFFVTAAIMGIVVRRRDRIRMGRPRPLPGTMRQAPHFGWLLGFLALALAGAVMVALLR